jgi:hypothetical protein
MEPWKGRPAYTYSRAHRSELLDLMLIVFIFSIHTLLVKGLWREEREYAERLFFPRIY